LLNNNVTYKIKPKFFIQFLYISLASTLVWGRGTGKKFLGSRETKKFKNHYVAWIIA